MPSNFRNMPLFCFGISFCLFSLGAIGTEITKIDIRFALMVQDMTFHGLGLFPTLNGVEYGDYPSGWIFCSWLTTFGGHLMSLWTLILPTILAGAYTVTLVYLTGEGFRKGVGFTAVMFLLVTPEFLSLFCGFGIDVPVMAAGATMLYLFSRKHSVFRTLSIFAVLLLISFLVRGPMGLILLGAGTGGYLLAGREWKNVLLFGCIGVITAIFCCLCWYAAIHFQGGPELWNWFLDCQLYSRMKRNGYGTCSIDVLLAFAPVAPIALGVLLPRRQQKLPRTAVGWLGYTLLPVFILSIPGDGHLRYFALTLPGFALLAAYVWCENIPKRFPGNRFLLPAKRFEQFALPLMMTALAVLTVVGCFLTEPALLPWGHFAVTAILAAACRPLCGVHFKQYCPVIMTGIFLTVALNPFLAALENSECFIARVERDRNGLLYLYEMGPDHDDLKYVLGVSPEKRGRIQYLYAEKLHLPEYYARMYPSAVLAEKIGRITGDDILILRNRQQELESLRKEAEKNGRQIQIRHTGSLGHRKFAAIRLTKKEEK